LTKTKKTSGDVGNVEGGSNAAGRRSTGTTKRLRGIAQKETRGRTTKGWSSNKTLDGVKHRPNMGGSERKSLRHRANKKTKKTVTPRTREIDTKK